MAHQEGRRSYWLSRADDLVMIPLALVSVALLAWEFTANLSPQQELLLGRIDLGIALLFLFEFCVKFILANDKGDYFRHNWWYLLASIPITTPATQALRALRLLRLIRLLRVTSGAKEFFESTGIIYVATVFGVLLIAGAAAFELFEFGTNSNVHGFGDALWWALTTITTVGYGDFIL